EATNGDIDPVDGRVLGGREHALLLVVETQYRGEAERGRRYRQDPRAGAHVQQRTGWALARGQLQQQLEAQARAGTRARAKGPSRGDHELSHGAARGGRTCSAGTGIPLTPAVAPAGAGIRIGRWKRFHRSCQSSGTSLVEISKSASPTTASRSGRLGSSPGAP